MMEVTIEMPWERDLSKNHNRLGPAGNWNYKSHVAAWMDRLGWELKFAALEGRHKRGVTWIVRPPLHVTVSFRYPTAHKRDDHNYYEVICDALKGVMGIDDDEIRISTASVEVNRADPGFAITIEDTLIG